MELLYDLFVSNTTIGTGQETALARPLGLRHVAPLHFFDNEIIYRVELHIRLENNSCLEL
jgi:hypothetical protein